MLGDVQGFEVEVRDEALFIGGRFGRLRCWVSSLWFGSEIPLKLKKGA